MIPTGPLAEKLRREPDPQAAAFIAAVDTDDELEVDADAVVSRGEDDDALVMSWICVPASRWSFRKTVCPSSWLRWLALHWSSEGCSDRPSRSSSQEDEPWLIIEKLLLESTSPN